MSGENDYISVSDAIKITQLENNVEKFEQRIKELEGVNQELEEKKNSLTEELEKLKIASVKATEIASEKEKLAEEVETLKQKTSALEEEKGNLDNEFEELKNNLLKKNEETSNIQRELTNFQEQLTTEKTSVEKWQTKVSEAEVAKNEAEQIVQQLRDEKAIIEGKYNDLLAESSKLEQFKDDIRNKEEALRRFQIIAETDPNYSWLTILEQYKVIELKRLAMAAGTSTHSILSYATKLESAGLVEIEMHGKDDQNPTIKLK
ncbi:MAG: hypothetical protein KAS95_07885 [Candidatus Heimdallarchaeota archaeon]|nr:hypothetical protein [Candidatus Heimdallarchaeota archaeon]